MLLLLSLLLHLQVVNQLLLPRVVVVLLVLLPLPLGSLPIAAGSAAAAAAAAVSLLLMGIYWGAAAVGCMAGPAGNLPEATLPLAPPGGDTDGRQALPAQSRALLATWVPAGRCRSRAWRCCVVWWAAGCSGWVRQTTSGLAADSLLLAEGLMSPNCSASRVEAPTRQNRRAQHDTAC